MLPISQSYKIKVEGKFDLGEQVNKLLKDFTDKLTGRGGPPQTFTEEKDDTRTTKEAPLISEFANDNGEKLHVYGVHNSDHKNDDNEQSNIVVRKRRRSGLILII